MRSLSLSLDPKLFQRLLLAVYVSLQCRDNNDVLFCRPAQTHINL